jgi:ABC-type transport system substrate-binding protein
VKRRHAAGLLAAAPLVPALAASDGPASAAPQRVLRLAFDVEETGFDPARIIDIYSRTVTAHIFEAPYTYDLLARPAQIVPLTAAGMPEVSKDFRVWTVRLLPGIHFADDPAFKGRRRELIAADYVYAYKRFADPANRSPAWSSLEEIGIEGLLSLREKAVATGRPFDYDAPVAGLRMLDRYTFQIRLDRPRPSLLNALAGGDLLGAVAREVVEHYGEHIEEHPVGTGPFKLASWRRSSRIVLERNPDYRERRYQATPAVDDSEGRAWLARFRGRRLPMVDRVEVSIIPEQQPLWLSFLNDDIDLVALPSMYVDQALPNGRVAPHLARRSIRGMRTLEPASSFTYFNMLDPIVGGLSPDKVALRRAISLGVDIEREIRQVRNGQAIPAQSPLVPHTSGYDPAFRSTMSEYNPARAKALLDLYGYVDRDGDGWRELPDGRPLVLEMATQPDRYSRQHDELWKRNMDALGLRVRFVSGQWAEQLKLASTGKLMMWTVGGIASSPDGLGSLAQLHGPQAGGQNLAHFRLEEMDRLYERLGSMADGPQREALFDRAKRLAVAYMPYRHHVHTYVNDLVQPWLIGYRRPLFWLNWWEQVDIDPALRPNR